MFIIPATGGPGWWRPGSGAGASRPISATTVPGTFIGTVRAFITATRIAITPTRVTAIGATTRTEALHIRIGPTRARVTAIAADTAPVPTSMAERRWAVIGAAWPPIEAIAAPTGAAIAAPTGADSAAGSAVDSAGVAAAASAAATALAAAMALAAVTAAGADNVNPEARGRPRSTTHARSV